MKALGITPWLVTLAFHASVAGGLVLWRFPISQHSLPEIASQSSASGGEAGQPQEIILRVIAAPTQIPRPKKTPTAAISAPNRILAANASVVLPPPAPLVLSPPPSAPREAAKDVDASPTPPAVASATRAPTEPAKSPRASRGRTQAAPGRGHGVGSSTGDGRGSAGVAYRRKAPLEYPRVAIRSGLEGLVKLRVLVLPSGRAGEVCVAKSSGHDVLDRAAITCAQRSEYRPATRSGQSVSTWVDASFRFDLAAVRKGQN